MPLSQHDLKSLVKAHDSAAEYGVGKVRRHIFLCCDEERAKCAAAGGCRRAGTF